MLSDRSYMRSDPGRTKPSFLVWFLGALVAIYVLHNLAFVWFRSDLVFRLLALSPEGLRSGQLWTPLTYALLHGSLTHLLLNGLGLFFLGRALQDEIGEVRLAQLTLVAAALGAFSWAGVNFQRGGNLLGASGVAMAYLGVFAGLHPRRPITLLLFFVLPVTILPIWMAAIFGGIDLLGLLFKELPHNGSLYGVAHSAHLGGLVAGWLFHRFVLAPGASNRPLVEAPTWVKRRADRPPANYSVNLPPSAPARTVRPAPPAQADSAGIRAEVDRILDKINLHGFGSLTESERRTLDEARRHLHPR